MVERKISEVAENEWLVASDSTYGRKTVTSLLAKTRNMMNIEAILRQIVPLDRESQTQIYRHLGEILDVRSGSEGQKFRLSELMGSMKGVYSDPNTDEATRRKQADEFIQAERESWER